MLFFLSYSRNELLFAEWLKHELNPPTSSKLEIWFDLERLDVGKSWEKQRDAGLDSCDGLILVASKAALASVQVEYEWRYALDANKPIVVVWYERVKLPPELADVSKINLASLNKDDVERLKFVLMEQAPANDPPPVKLLGIPLGMPASTKLQILYLLRGWLIYFVFAGVLNILYPDRDFLVATLLFVGIWSLIAAWLLLNRVRFSRISRFLSWAVISNRILGVVMALGFCMFALPSTVRTVKPTRAEELAYATGLAFGLYALYHAIAPDGFWRRKNMLAWLIKGLSASGGGSPNRPPVIEDFVWFNRVDQSPFLRAARGNRFNHRTPEFPQRVQLQYAGTGTPKTYTLFNTTKIRRWTERIHAAMKQHDHQHIAPESGSSDVDYDIVLLGQGSTQEDIQAIRQRGNNLITIIADNVDTQRFPGVLDHQVVDLRSWNFDLLEGLAYRLTGAPGGKRAFAMQVDPRRFDTSIRPPITNVLAFYRLPSISLLAGMTSIILVSVMFLYFLLSGSFADLISATGTSTPPRLAPTIMPTATVPPWEQTELPFGVEEQRERLTQVPQITPPARPTSPFVTPAMTPTCLVVNEDGEMLPCDE